MSDIMIRPLQVVDYAPLLALTDAAVPHDQAGNREFWRMRQQFDATERLQRQWVAVDAATGRLHGYLLLEQQQSTQERIRLVILPETFAAPVPELLWQFLQAERATLIPSSTLYIREYARDTALLDFFAARGFVETARLHDNRWPAVAAPCANAISLASWQESDAAWLQRLYPFVKQDFAAQGRELGLEQLDRWVRAQDPMLVWLLLDASGDVTACVAGTHAESGEPVYLDYVALGGAADADVVTLVDCLCNVTAQREAPYVAMLATEADGRQPLAARLRPRERFTYVTLDLPAKRDIIESFTVDDGE